MSGAYKKPEQSTTGGWVVHEKRSGGQYDKYDTQHVVIVGAVKKGSKPHTIYFSKRSFEEMGRPKYVEVRVNGTSVGFFPVKEDVVEDYPNAYTVSLSGESAENKGDGRAMLSARTVISEHDLRSGAYTASVFIEGSTHAIVINSNDKPSTV